MPHLWCLKPDFLEKLEFANLFFFKRLLALPRCTPGYVIRLDINIDHISIPVLEAAMKWVIKILEMPEHRLPKVCFFMLIKLMSTPFKVTNLNCAQQLKDQLCLVNEDGMLNNLSSKHWKANIDKVIAKYRSHRRSVDLSRYCTSSACQFNYLSHSSLLSTQILTRLPPHISKSLLQMRIASTYATNLTINKTTHKLYPINTCKYCHLNENET